MKPKFLVEP